jgi:hypothetical protein
VAPGDLMSLSPQGCRSVPDAGPEAIGFAVGSTPGQRFLRTLGQQLNDAYFAGLADRIAQ